MSVAGVVLTVANADVDASTPSFLAWVINGFLRLGTLDGVHLTGRAHFRNLPSGGLWPSGLEGTLQVPVAPGWWLRARGFGDASGIAVGDGGIRMALGKDPARASSFVSAMVGVAFSQGVIGPSVGVGYEQRFP